MAGWKIRERSEADLAGVAALLVQTHHSHAYPVVLIGDMAGWAAGTGVLEGWVAADDSDGRIIGHVVLTEASRDELPTPQWSAATGLPAERLGVVRRLVVDADRQGDGLGRRLLATAADAAHARGLHPVLDMAINLTEAAQLYESAGFERVGQYDLDLAPYLPEGQTDTVIAGRRTAVLPVVTWVGPGF